MKTIFILSDSTNRRFLSMYSQTGYAKTPNLDRLASKGTVFENHWCGSAPCMPARRDLMTGRLNFLEKPWGGIEPFDQTLQSLLKENNVYTKMITDHYLYMHIGGENYWNNFTSLDLIRGQEFDSLNMPAGKNGIVEQDIPDNYRGVYSQEHIENYSKFDSEEDYPSPMTMKKAANWLEENKDADNFLLWIEGFDPHEPFDVPDKYIDLYKDEDFDSYEDFDFYWPEYKKDAYNAEDLRRVNIRYKALLTMTDYYIGKIFDVLDKYDMWDDTQVIFTTDHGYMLGEHGYTAKNFMPAYNEVFHIPLIIWDPRFKNNVKRTDALTQNIDLFPTVLNYFNIDLSKLHYNIHGIDLSEILSGTKDKNKDYIIYGYFGKSVNLTDGKYTYFRAPKSEENRPLFVYTAIPTTLRQYYGVGCIDKNNYTKIEFGNLKFTDYPVFKIPAQIIDFKNPSQEYFSRSPHNSQTLLFDLSNDYEQNSPITNKELLNCFEEKLKEALAFYDAPDEQFERLGL